MTFAPRFIYGDLDLTDAPFMVEFGLDLGNAQAVTAVIDSLLTDGELISGERDSNREISLTVLVEGSDLAALADAEALLVAQARKQRNTLTVEPGDDVGPTTVFDTFRAQVEWQRDDDFERSNLRRYVLTIPALPFTRSEGQVVDISVSPPSAGAGDVVYAAESTTGWATYSGGSPNASPSFSVDSTIYNEGTGSIKSLVTQWEEGANYSLGNGTGGIHSPNGGTSRDQITGLSIATGAGGGYISFAIRFDPAYSLSELTRIWQSTTSGVWTEVTSYAAIKFETNGFIHYRWEVDPDLTILGFRFEATHKMPGQPTGVARPFTWYDDFRLVTTPSSEQQIIKTLTVEGSARTIGSLRIGSGAESVSLGQVLVATIPTQEVPAGFSPEGRPYVTQGDLTADSTALGGSHYTPDASTYSSATGKPIFKPPANMLTPGAYQIVTLVKESGATIVSGVQAQVEINGTLTGPTTQTEVTAPSTTTDWQFLPLGTLYLPPVPLGAGSEAVVRLLFKGAKLGNVYMIPAWSVGGRAVADYSIIDCGLGVPSLEGTSSFLWIDSPSADQPQGGYWRGPTSDRLGTKSAWADAVAPGTHAFEPGKITGFLAVTGAQAPTLALEYYPAWYGHAAI